MATSVKIVLFDNSDKDGIDTPRTDMPDISRASMKYSFISRHIWKSPKDRLTATWLIGHSRTFRERTQLMVPLYAARVSDLKARDFVRVEMCMRA